MQRRRTRTLIADGICLAVLVLLVMPRVCVPIFTTDSWTFYQLSQHVFDDFYRVSTVRSFEHTGLYSTSFPPLYPVLLACVRKVHDWGIYTGVLLNAALAMATLWPLNSLIKRLGLPRLVGNLCFLSLLANRHYLSELTAARTMPLAVLLYVCLAGLLFDLAAARTSRLPVWGRMALVGGVAGLLCLARFDFMLAAIATGGVAHWLTSARRWTSLLAYYVMLAVAVSPWNVYSEARFGEVFVSDNARIAAAVTPSSIAYFYTDDEPRPTVRDAPGPWLRSLVLEKAREPAMKLVSLLYEYLPLLLLGGITLGSFATRGAAPQAATIARPLAPEASSTAEPIRRALLGLWFLQIWQLLPLALTGYSDQRYFTTLLLLAMLTLFYLLRQRIVWQTKLDRWCGLVGAAGLATLVLYVQQGGYFRGTTFPPRFDQSMVNPAKFLTLVEALENSAPADSKPVLLPVSGAIEPYQFSALTGEITVRPPLNLGEKNVAALVQRYGITHILDPGRKLLGGAKQPLAVERLVFPGLYRVVTDPATRTGAARDDSPPASAD